MSADIILRAAGPLRRAYEAVDWAATPLGTMEGWSRTLTATVLIGLRTRFPVTLFWGPEFVLVYNEAYVRLIAEKHPAALGARARDVFPEAWDDIGPKMEGVLAGGGATWVEDASVPLHRSGFLEEAYFTFSYSPVHGDGGEIEGVLDIATETTRQVVDRRRLRLLSRLREQLGGLTQAPEVLERALPVLRADADDLPAVDLRLAGRADGDRDVRLPDAPAFPLGDREVVEETAAGRVAWLPLGPAPAGGERPVLVVLLSSRLASDPEYVRFLRLIVSSLAQALDRISARVAERRVASSERRLSEALQRSLLTQPVQPEHLQVAVRYRPAAVDAQVGGDWYDAFVVPNGLLTVAIGDVTGHDRRAAAAMAQVRNLLRGVAFTLQEPPGRVLSGLDAAMRGLRIDVYATAVLAQVERDGDGGRRLRWSNAGHPPPVLLAADGGVRLLETVPDVLLGLTTGDRADHCVPLEPGSTLVLYTDGLVERRDTPMEERLDWLAGALEGRHGSSAEELCDHLVAQLGDAVDDDVALLVVRALPES